MAFFLWLIARVSGCAGKLILKYLMASHLGTFHLLFMQWLLFSFSVFYNPIRITSNLLTPETTANNDSGQKRRSACLGKLIPRILFSPTGRKTPDCFSWAFLSFIFTIVGNISCLLCYFFFVFIFGCIAISGMAMALFAARLSEDWLEESRDPNPFIVRPSWLLFYGHNFSISMFSCCVEFVGRICSNWVPNRVRETHTTPEIGTVLSKNKYKKSILLAWRSCIAKLIRLTRLQLVFN